MACDGCCRDFLPSCVENCLWVIEHTSKSLMLLFVHHGLHQACNLVCLVEPVMGEMLHISDLLVYSIVQRHFFLAIDHMLSKHARDDADSAAVGDHCKCTIPQLCTTHRTNLCTCTYVAIHISDQTSVQYAARYQDDITTLGS